MKTSSRLVAMGYCSLAFGCGAAFEVIEHRGIATAANAFILAAVAILAAVFVASRERAAARAAAAEKERTARVAALRPVARAVPAQPAIAHAEVSLWLLFGLAMYGLVHGPRAVDRLASEMRAIDARSRKETLANVAEQRKD